MPRKCYEYPLLLAVRLAAVWALLGLCGAAMAASSCATPDPNTPTISTCFFDLTASPSSTAAPASAVLNGGIFQVPGPNDPLGQGFIVGTGVFQPFVRIQEQGNGNAASNGVETGFNTDGRAGTGQAFTELDNHDKGGSNWNHSIKLGNINIVTVGGKQYYEFLLDSNEQGNTKNSGISLDEFKVFTAAKGDIVSGYTGADDTAGFTNFQLNNGATLKYDMDAGPGGDASILMDYSNFSGSGNGVDLQALVPVTNFAGVSADSFVYLYSKFGWTGDQCKVTGNQISPCMTPDGTTGQGTPLGGSQTKVGSLSFSVDAGFEEWSTRKATPLPGTVLLLGIGLAGLAVVRKGGKKAPSVSAA